MQGVLKAEYLKPMYWRTWLAIAGLELSQQLTVKQRNWSGRALGAGLHRLISPRRRVVETNLRLCFPEMSEPARAQMAKEIFREHGLALLETALSWHLPPAELFRRTRFVGVDNVQSALEQGRGVIILGSHFTVLDMGIAMLGRAAPVHMVYRPHNNPLFNLWINRGRRNFAAEVIESGDMRRVVRCLKEGKLVWFAPDQDEGERHSVYASFFGVSAATVTSTARLARMTGAAVVPVGLHRRATQGQQYEVEFFPPLASFPTGDADQDAALVNAAHERAIRKYPAQYMWVHRRFKTHPRGKNFLYQR